MIPGQGTKTAQAVEELSPWATSREKPAHGNKEAMLPTAPYSKKKKKERKKERKGKC